MKLKGGNRNRFKPIHLIMLELMLETQFAKDVLYKIPVSNMAINADCAGILLSIGAYGAKIIKRMSDAQKEKNEYTNNLYLLLCNKINGRSFI